MKKKEGKDITIGDLKDLVNDVELSINIFSCLHGFFEEKNKIAICFCLLNDSPSNKMKIYKELQDLGLQINYKNVVKNIDKLEQEGFVRFERIEKENNSVYVYPIMPKIRKMFLKFKKDFKQLHQIFNMYLE